MILATENPALDISPSGWADRIGASRASWGQVSARTISLGNRFGGPRSASGPWSEVARTHRPGDLDPSKVASDS